MGKHTGSIRTDKSYNDQAETQLAYEHFEFNGQRVSLSHPLDHDGYRNPDYVSVDAKSGYCVFVYHDRIQVISPEGFAGIAETFKDLIAKCRIADKLAAVNQWK